MSEVLKTGFAAVIGQPNAGKSTLVNALVGEKVSIVTSKPQTTRQRVTGILSLPEAQIVFLDAPGIIRAESGLNHFLQRECEEILKDCDVILVVLNLDAKSESEIDQVIEVANASNKPWLAVISKEDLPMVHRVSLLREKLRGLNKDVISVSAINNPQKTRELIVPLLLQHLPESSELLYNKELFTTQSLREMSAEIIREKCFEFLHQEIPFGLAVRIIRFIENEGSVVKVYAELLLAKENHKAMVIGRQGQVLKRVGQAARKEIEALVGKKVYLDLHVKVHKNWPKHSGTMKELGYWLNDKEGQDN